MAALAQSPHFDRGLRLMDGTRGRPDLASARAEFASAADEGDVRAAHLHASLVAGGIGGPRDWAAAVAALRRWAPSDRLAARQIALVEAMDLLPDGRPKSVPPARSLHERKKIFLFEGFAVAAECAFLIDMAAGRLEPATVLAAPDRSNERPQVRDADHGGFTLLEEPLFLRAINLRIAAATGTDVRQGESFQVIRYRPGQQYRPHVDGVGGGGNKREMTALLYLNEDYAGGETAFTELGLTVRGRRGDLLLFHNLSEDGELDRDMRHAGLPVSEGVKLIASRWILQRAPYDEAGDLIAKTLWS